MPQVVFLFQTDGAVGQKYKSAASGEAADGVIGIDPGVHARGGFELGARWPQFRRDDRRSRLQCFEKRGQFDQYTERFMHAAASLPSLPLAPYITPVEELSRLRRALGGGPRLLVKRDDAIPFAFGGNKVRKMRLVGADAVASGADTLITAGGLQSNHARVTAATAATLGMQCVLVLNGAAPAQPTGNTLLDGLLGAHIEYVERREDRATTMAEIADRLRGAGRHPYVIPIGASTPLGAAAFVQAIDELKAQGVEPQTIVHATSSGGTQAGLIAGCIRAGLSTKISGISADAASADLEADIRAILAGMGSLVGIEDQRLERARVDVDDRFVGGGYGVATPESREALELAARTEALFLDSTYTAKALAGLIASVRRREFDDDETVLFWHTGGQVGLFR